MREAGRQCRHNLNYWSFGDYLGVGAGAHGKLSFPAWRRHGAHHAAPRTAPLPQRRGCATVRRVIPPAELPFEFMLNALRLPGGFSRTLFSERTGLAWDKIAPQMALAEQRGLVLGSGDSVRPSPLGLRFLNEALLLFMAETPRKAGDSALSIVVTSPRRAGRPLYSQARRGWTQNECITSQTGQVAP